MTSGGKIWPQAQKSNRAGETILPKTHALNETFKAAFTFFNNVLAVF